MVPRPKVVKVVRLLIRMVYCTKNDPLMYSYKENGECLYLFKMNTLKQEGNSVMNLLSSAFVGSRMIEALRAYSTLVLLQNSMWSRGTRNITIPRQF